MKTQPDEYEKRYMAADDALASSRARMPWWAHAVFAALAIFVTYTVWQTHGWSSGVAALLLVTTLALWATNMVVRVTVTPLHLHIQHGLFGPTIPLDQIEDVWVEKNGLSKWLKYVGWGLGGKGVDGSYGYTVPGTPLGLSVRFRHRGRSRTAFVSSNEPESLRETIAAARARPTVAQAVTEGRPMTMGADRDDEPQAALDRTRQGR